MKNKKIYQRLGGFTLIEILVVIAIIAVLSSIVLVGLGPTQRLGRDAKRLSDLSQIQHGLELYYYKCGYYPGVAQQGVTCGAYSAISTWSALTAALKGSNIGVTQIPNDPTSGVDYKYGSDGVTYTIGAQLENLSNTAFQQSPDATSNGVPCSRVNGVYCMVF